MRILKLHFRNLNSLVGDWVIDFTDPAFQEDGLFAIIGPTGAGKTTILDAISLALFRQTPRLGKMSKLGNEIMSRQTNDCMAEGTFRVGGKTYRAFFSQKRSRAKAKFPFAEPKCELVEVTGGEKGDVLLASSKEKMDEKRDEILGLDFEQFSRSVLLAQGQFRDFLFEKQPGERAKLLEKITGTGIYTVISKKVFEIFSQKKHELEALQTALNTRQAERFSPEEITQYKEEREKCAVEMLPLEKEIAELDGWIVRRKALVALEEEQKNGEAERDRLDEEKIRFAPEKEQLERHHRAKPLVTWFQGLEQMRKTLVKKKQEWEQIENQLKTLSQQMENLLPQIEEAKQTLQNAEKEQSEQVPILAEVRQLDQDFKNHQKLWNEAKQNWENRQRRLDEIIGEQNRLEKDRERAKVLGEEIESLREERTQRLGTQTAGEIQAKKDQVIQILHQWKEILAIFEEREKVQRNRAEQAAIRERSQANQKRLVAQQQETAAHLEALKEEIDSQNRVVQQSEDVACLNTYRGRLVEGEPCPLCGATHHPLELPKREMAEEKAKQKTLKAEEQRQSARLLSLAAEYGQEEAGEKNAAKRLAELATEETVLQTQLAEGLKNLSLEKEPEKENVRIEMASWKAKEEKLTEDYRAAEDFNVKIQKKETALKTLEKNRISLDALEVSKKVAEQEKSGAEAAVQKRQAEYDACRRKRWELFQDRNPDNEEKRLVQAVRKAEQTVSERQSQKKAGETEFQLYENLLKKTKSEIETTEKGVENLEKEWADSLQSARFSDEQDFSGALLTQEEEQRKQRRQKELETQEANLTAKFLSIKERWERESVEPLPPDGWEILQEKRNTKKALLNEQNAKMGALEEKLRQNELREKQIAAEMENLEVFQKKTIRWEKLNHLIGGKETLRYRRIVQRFSLEILLGNANRQLERLAPRYVLVLPSEAPEKELSIACQDAYFNHEIRPVSNLSGGETFLISLALALGLSRMSSRNISMESLFLDEGFGTLDEETLQTALESLSLFQSGGGEQKLIGIISHVEALQERIVNKIEVLPGAMGRSRLRGVGVGNL